MLENSVVHWRNTLAGCFPNGVGLCIVGIPRDPVIEFEVLSELILAMRRQGLLSRLVYATWHGHLLTIPHIHKRLLEADAIIVEVAEPTAFRSSRVFQHASINAGLAFFGDNEYVIRCRTDFFLDDFISFVTADLGKVGHDLLTVRCGMKSPFGFGDRIFSGPVALLRRCVNRDYIFEESRLDHLAQSTFFSHRYFQEVRLFELITNYVRWDDLHRAMETAVRSRGALPASLVRTYAAYLYFLRRDFNCLPNRADAGTLADFFFSKDFAASRDPQSRLGRIEYRVQR